jgi:hypothetical protein
MVAVVVVDADTELEFLHGLPSNSCGFRSLDPFRALREPEWFSGQAARKRQRDSG